VERRSVARTDAVERARRTLFMKKHFLPEGETGESCSIRCCLFCRKQNMASDRPSMMEAEVHADLTIT
jgi:hypothetical protein